MSRGRGRGLLRLMDAAAAASPVCCREEPRGRLCRVEFVLVGRSGRAKCAYSDTHTAWGRRVRRSLLSYVLAGNGQAGTG